MPLSYNNDVSVKGFIVLIIDDFGNNAVQRQKQLLKLGNIVIKNGIAIGIGHVGAEGGLATAQAIKSVYPIIK
ncbi:divergent polysaccharide deacetylase family protein [Peptococcaceae bacterium]|nr:divergent polysaccharide deacetylase family protein [Peptococcaceae bacterium]